LYGLSRRAWDPHLGLPFLYIYQMRNALLVAPTRANTWCNGTLAETVVNIALDYGLIFGHLGLPAMGFNGAALLPSPPRLPACWWYSSSSTPKASAENYSFTDIGN